MAEIRGYRIAAESGGWTLVERTGDDADAIHSDESSAFRLTEKDFADCPFKETIFDGKDVLAVTLSGSYVMGSGRTASDYDLVVYVVGEAENPPLKYKLLYKGRRLHWYYDGIGTFGSKQAVDGANPSMFAHLMGMRYLKKKHILYASDKGKGFVGKLLKGGAEMSSLMCRLYCLWERRNGRFDSVLSTSDDRLMRMGKLSWLRYFAPASVCGDEIDVGLIKRLKGVKQDGILPKDADALRDAVRSYMRGKLDETDAESLEERLISKWSSLWESDR